VRSSRRADKTRPYRPGAVRLVGGNSPGVELGAVGESPGVVHREHVPVLGLDIAALGHAHHVDLQLLLFGLVVGGG
jgi:hypothetical protein